MSFATIDHLRESLAGPAPKVYAPEYAAKMLHDLPQADVVDRPVFVLKQCKDKRVLEFGASGPLTAAIAQVALTYAGVDRAASDGVTGLDLDDVTVPRLPDVGCDVVVACEVLEHLTNPGYFLQRLRAQYPLQPLLVSVPNAYTVIAQKHLRKGRENVNLDHVAWYSPRTLRTLLERYGYTISEWHWYNGEPGTAEGFIVVAR